MSSDLSCSDFLKARHIWTITMVTTKSKLQMEYNKEVTSLWSAALGLVYVCFGSFVFVYFQNGNSCILFLNTATIAFNFICKNKCYLKKEFPSKSLNLQVLVVIPIWNYDTRQVYKTV
jgi:hypothetical protein